MYKRIGKVRMSDMYCEYCGFHMTIPRLPGETRSKGHKKKLWCYACKTERNFNEVRDKDFTLQHVIGY